MTFSKDPQTPQEKHKEHLSYLSASAFLCRSSGDPEVTRHDIFVVGVTQMSAGKEHLLVINIKLWDLREHVIC